MNDSEPSVTSRRSLVAYSLVEDEAGELLRVVGSFPALVGNAACIAALVEAAAADKGVTFARYLQRVAAAAPPPIGEIEYTPRPAHRPALDWEHGFGASLSHLCEIAQRLRVENPRLTKIKSFGAALQEARKSANMHRLSASAEKAAAAKMKQACRPRRSPHRQDCKVNYAFPQALARTPQRFASMVQAGNSPDDLAVAFGTSVKLIRQYALNVGPGTRLPSLMARRGKLTLKDSGKFPT